MIEKIAILMKNGLSHWVSNEIGDRLQDILQKQASHTFIKIKELGITINTAEIAGVYTQSQYDDLMKIKQGMWQCQYKKWHTKRETCNCAKENAKIEREKEERRREQEYEKNLTDEQKEKISKKFQELREEIKRLGLNKRV